MYLSLLNAVRPFICGDGLPVRRHLTHCPVISWSCMLSKRQTIPCGDGTCRSLRVRPQPVTQHSAMAQPTLDLVEAAIGAAYYPVAVGLRRALPLKNESAVLRFQWKAMLFFQMHRPSKSLVWNPAEGRKMSQSKPTRPHPSGHATLINLCQKCGGTARSSTTQELWNAEILFAIRHYHMLRVYIYIYKYMYIYIIRCTICENKGNF